jgi:hypothetical protein
MFKRSPVALPALLFTGSVYSPAPLWTSVDFKP